MIDTIHLIKIFVARSTRVSFCLQIFIYSFRMSFWFISIRRHTRMWIIKCTPLGESRIHKRQLKGHQTATVVQPVVTRALERVVFDYLITQSLIIYHRRGQPGTSLSPLSYTSTLSVCRGIYGDFSNLVYCECAPCRIHLALFRWTVFLETCIHMHT